MKTLKLDILDAGSEEFLRYGVLATAEGKKADAACPGFSFWNRLGLPEMAGAPSVCIVESYATPNAKSTIFERHGDTAETLIPVDGEVVLVLALDAPGGKDTIDPASVRAFRLRQGEAAILAPGTWHYAPLTGAARARTFVVFDRDTPEKDMLVIDTAKDFGLAWAVEF